MKKRTEEKNNSTCEVCFRIACKKCSWVATEHEVAQIQQGLLFSCPLCGWRPDEITS
jgi:hypothetical protein